ncbi:class I SAM-dependent methyltransferase [Iamia sp.]|uniref:class I SAM-dependent methyltransferase n=1 Tax=Iamia sp. TaxID=2722710 RepID=UPI002D1B881F|nr:class I SAM-dependent methyltransferase [Iamia sp.]HXH57113.1 class I SAM-dependent methyltransferase [Iamia sp.]
MGRLRRALPCRSPRGDRSATGAQRRRRGPTAYDWVSEDLPDGRVVDVGCGSGPTQPMVSGWVGVDRSRPELEVARRHGRGPVVRASAAALPVRDRSVDAAMAAMSLMVIKDPASAVAELARVLRPGGIVQVLLPADRPLTVTDRARYGLLLAVLGRRALPFPRPDVAAAPGPWLAAAGFAVVADERRRFRFAVTGRADADLFIDSLYLPNVGARRVGLARAFMRSSGHGEIGVPLRRVTARLTR